MDNFWRSGKIGASGRLVYAKTYKVPGEAGISSEEPARDTSMGIAATSVSGFVKWR